MTDSAEDRDHLAVLVREAGVDHVGGLSAHAHQRDHANMELGEPGNEIVTRAVTDFCNACL